ncbi:MAG TPA: TAXI family TRAP transporter solute-binding subunit [Candidatus Binatia bacterium]|jgi:hypothetical protein
MGILKKSARYFWLVILAFTLPTAPLRADDRRYTIHTSGLNSSVYVNMLYFANLVNQHTKTFTLITLASDGGPSNMISVNDGKASFGTSTAESVKAAYDGTGEFQKKAQTRIRHVASFGFSLMFIYVRPDSPINSIDELKGKRIVFGGGTGSLLLGKQILEAYGMANDVRAERGDTEKARGALERKEIDAIFTVARLPIPAYAELVARKEIKFLAIEPAPMKALQTTSPLYLDVDLKDYYPAYGTSTKAVGLPGPVVTRDDMDPAITYEMLKIVYAHMTELQRMNDGFRNDSPASGLKGLAIPLHSGAERFFKEAGVLK